MQAMGQLALTPMQYYDLTLYELTAMLAGYNVRWEEEWRRTRAIYTLLFNIHSKSQKKDYELMPFPSEANDIAFQKMIANWQAEVELEESLALKTEANGSGISS